MKEESEFKKLLSNFAQHGQVTWIGIRPTRKAGLIPLKEVQVLTASLKEIITAANQRVKDMLPSFRKNIF